MIRHWLLGLLLMLLLIGCLNPDFDGTTETIGQTYQQYMANEGDKWFDPKGASEISLRTSATTDGYDAWWHFTASAKNFEAIVVAVAKQEKGPKSLQFTSKASLPPKWKAESAVPSWWKVNGGASPKSIHWCHAIGEAERHRGWFFAFNSKTQETWCWHWSHQWSASECS